MHVQVDEQARIELGVGMDGADFEQAVLQELRDAQALRAGIGEVELVGDAPLEQVEVLGQADARHDQVHVVHPGRVDLGQRTGKKVGLLLIVAFETDPVARFELRYFASDDFHLTGDITAGPSDRHFEQPDHYAHRARLAFHEAPIKWIDGSRADFDQDFIVPSGRLFNLFTFKNIG